MGGAAVDGGLRIVGPQRQGAVEMAQRLVAAAERVQHQREVVVQGGVGRVARERALQQRDGARHVAALRGLEPCLVQGGRIVLFHAQKASLSPSIAVCAA